MTGLRRLAIVLAAATVAIGIVYVGLGQVLGTRPGDPALVESDARFAACGIPLDRTWMAFAMAHARDFSQHFPGWSAGADELEVADPALVVIGNARVVPGGGAFPDLSATPAPSVLSYDLCIAVGQESAAIIHNYGPTRFDEVRPDLGRPPVAMP